MKIKTEYPFDQYDGYLVLNPEGRRNVCLVDSTNKVRTTTSYARYLMSVHLKRFLTRQEHVDHVDEDKTNDVIENLQILSISENNKKNRLSRGKGKRMLLMNCPVCKNEFERQYRNSHIVKKGFFSTCSVACKHNALKLKLSKTEMIEIGVSQVIKEFRIII